MHRLHQPVPDTLPSSTCRRELSAQPSPARGQLCGWVLPCLPPVQAGWQPGHFGRVKRTAGRGRCTCVEGECPGIPAEPGEWGLQGPRVGQEESRGPSEESPWEEDASEAERSVLEEQGGPEPRQERTQRRTHCCAEREKPSLPSRLPSVLAGFLNRRKSEYSGEPCSVEASSCPALEAAGTQRPSLRAVEVALLRQHRARVGAGCSSRVPSVMSDAAVPHRGGSSHGCPWHLPCSPRAEGPGAQPGACPRCLTSAEAGCPPQDGCACAGLAQDPWHPSSTAALVPG